MDCIEVFLQTSNLDGKLSFDILEKTCNPSFPQTKKLFTYFSNIMQAVYQSERSKQKLYKLSKKTIRGLITWKNAQLKMQIYPMQDTKYIFLHKGRKRESFVYEVCFGKKTISVCKLQGIGAKNT